MGCSGSVKVKPTPSKEEGTKQSQSVSDAKTNHIKGDRLSLVDARKRREEDSKNRLRRLSSLAPEEADKVRRNSSRLSRRSSPNIHSVPEEESPRNSSNENENSPQDRKKKKKKKKGSPLDDKTNQENNELVNNLNSESDEEVIRAMERHQYKNNSKPIALTSDERTSGEDDDNLVIEFHSPSEEKPRAPSHTQTGNNVKTSSKLYDGDARSSGDGKTDSPSLSLRNDTTNIDMRQSIDSLQLRVNANFLVNDIMSHALTLVNENDDKSNYSRQITYDVLGSVTTQNQKQQQSEDERAKNMVDQILGNALFVVKNETGSR